MNISVNVPFRADKTDRGGIRGYTDSQRRSHGALLSFVCSLSQVLPIETVAPLTAYL